MTTRWFGVVGFALVCASRAFAQCPQYTPIFSGPGFDEEPYAMARFDDGTGEKLYVGGLFTGAGGANAAHIAAWDGTSWQSLGGGTSGNVWSLVVHDDGSGGALYAGGVFLSAGGVSANRVARWNGASWSALGAGVDGRVNSLLNFDDGSGDSLYAAGTFMHAGGGVATRVARWNGSSWSAVGAGLNGEVHALAVHDDGTGPALYACGDFTNWVARWNGVSWQAIGAQLGPAPEMRALISYDDGPGTRWLFAGGRWMMGNATRVARWDGSNWQSMASGGPARVSNFETRSESSGLVLYAAGSVSVVRWNPVTGWSGFTGMPYAVTALGFFDDHSGHGEELYVGGPFLDLSCVFTSTFVQRIARFDGTSWRALQHAPHAFHAVCWWGEPMEVFALTRWRDPVDGRFKVVVGGGLFTTDDDPTVEGLAVWDGLRWSRFPGNYSAFMVGALTTWTNPITSQEVLVASGVFPAGSSGSNAVSQYDGLTWSKLQGAPTDVQAFASFQEPGTSFEALFAGGNFGVRRWNGVNWTTPGNGVGPCSALAVFDPPGVQGPGLYWAGSLVQRWDGTQWSLVPGGPVEIFALAVFDDGAGPNLFATTASLLWRFDGTSWSSYALGDPLAAYALAAFDDGTGPALYMPAGKRYRNGQVQSYGPSAGPSVQDARFIDMLAFEDENGAQKALWFAGDFQVAGGVPSRGIARWSDPCATLTSYCTAKINSQGCTPAIGWTGDPSIALSATTPFTITASNVINQKGGLLYFGAAGRSAVPFQGGFKCVRFPALRTPPRSSGGNVGPDDCSGVYAIDFTPWITGSNNELLSIGVTVDAQWWSRDPASASTTGLTDGLEFEIRP